VRSIKAKEFLDHDPELFAVYASGTIVAGCTTARAFVSPINVHPMVVPCVSVVIGVLLSRALRSFHRRVRAITPLYSRSSRPSRAP